MGLILHNPGGHVGIVTLGLFDLVLEGTDLGLGALLSGLKFTLSLGKGVLGVTPDLPTELEPLDRGPH